MRLAAGMILVVGSGIALGKIVFTSSDQTEHLWLLYYDLGKDAPVIDSVVLPIIALFIMVAIAFIPLGSEIGRRLALFKDHGQPLIGYAIDLFGSLSGVLAFLMMSEIGTRPIVWFTTGFLAVFGIVPSIVRSRLLFGLAAAVLVLCVHVFDSADRYSPYYGFRTQTTPTGAVSVLTNGSLHQVAIDLRKSPPVSPPPLAIHIGQGYRLGVSNLTKVPRRALVLGAGTGNDVTVLLDAGVSEVHAVEIDPVILEIGRESHPARPYDDSRVTIHNTDARAFLENTEIEFDFIVFGTLDSMTRLSALSNVRLDNFVYTVECMRAARSRLAKDGAMALYFMSADRNMDARLFSILREALGESPLLHSNNYHLFNKLFLAGPGVAHLKDNPVFRDLELEQVKGGLPTPTDDWPYLYLNYHTIPIFYLKVAGLVILFTVALLICLSSSLRTDFVDGRIDWEMMVFGAAFLLLETAFVTELNLLFGATWRTSGVVFASILFALVAATLMAREWPIKTRLSLTLVTAALIVIALLPLREIAPVENWAKVLFALSMCGVPVAFGGFAFASRFAARDSAQTAFGWNIIGAVLGGLLELLSMITGLKAMFLLAAVLYASLLWAAVRRESSA